MILRPLQPSDFSDVLALGAHLFRPEDELPQLEYALDVCFLELSFVAVENERILGFTVCCPPMTTILDDTILPFRSGSLELAFFGVSPACQGRGIGSRLLKETLHALFQRSLLVWLSVNVSNESAIRMYEHRGFQRVHSFYPCGAPEGCWLMCLADLRVPYVPSILSHRERKQVHSIGLVSYH